MTMRNVPEHALAVLLAGWLALGLAPGLGATLRAEAGEADEPANRPRLGFIGLHGGVFPILQEHAGDLGLDLHFITDGQLSARQVDLASFDLVFIEHLRTKDVDLYRDLFPAACRANPELRIINLGPPSTEAILKRAGLGDRIKRDPELDRYYPKSRENLQRFLIYVAATYLGQDREIEPPVEVAMEGLYHPDHPELFPSVDAFLDWMARHDPERLEAPRVALSVHFAHLWFQQPDVINALMRSLEVEGVLVAAIIDMQPGSGAFFEAFRPEIVVHTCHCHQTAAFREALDVPHVHSIFFQQQSIEEWSRNDKESLAGNEYAMHILSQEPIGAIEPQIGGGTVLGQGGEEPVMAIPDRITHIVERTMSWLALRLTPHSEKRIAFIYYDRELGHAELMRGSATGKFLNAPRSMVKVLKRLRTEGYTLDPVPDNEDELIGQLLDHGRQIGLWLPDELDRLARSGKAVMVPEESYRDWFEARVPEDRRAEVIRHWGEPPGQLMVWQDGQGRRFLVVPRIDLGHVILLPQPLRGEAHDPSLLHDRRIPPSHNYLATYFWLEEQFQAHALVHFGTHGTEFYFPGKPVGQSRRDWSDILMGRMPNINPWIVDNLGESAPAKRRAYAVLVSHLTPPIVDAGLSDELLNLNSTIEKWKTLEPGALRAKFQAEITRQVRQCRLDQDLKLSIPDEEMITSDQVDRVADYLHELSGEITPVSLHVLGEPPRDDLLVPYLVTILRRPFLEALAGIIPNDPSGPSPEHPGDKPAAPRAVAEQVVRMVVRQGMAPEEAIRAVGGDLSNGVPEEIQRGLTLARDLSERFQRTGEELDNLVRALDGRFVPPGPGNSPVRNPSSVPSGRNLYQANPQEIPTRPSWELGKTLVDQLLERMSREQGRYPERIGFDLSPFATFRDFGVMEAQILYLLGVEPVWDERNLVIDVKLIPDEALKRPRVDVFIVPHSLYDLNLPSRLELLDRAIRLVSNLGDEEGTNPIARHTEEVRQRLAARGLPGDRAEALSLARIFGQEPGQVGLSAYIYLIDRSGAWDTREEVIARYLRYVKYVYTRDHWGEYAPEAFDETIQGTEAVLRTWNSPMIGPLSNKYTWLYGGSLSLAVRHLTGREPEFLLADVRDPDHASMIGAEDALHREFRARLFNRKWIEGMMKEGFAGADQMAKMVGNAVGWQIMRPGSVPDATWDEIEAVYVRDELGLSIREWFESENPYALQSVTEALLETARKGFWHASPETLRRLAREYSQSIIAHGPNGGLRGANNDRLVLFVERALQDSGTPEAERLLVAYHARMSGAAGSGSGSGPSTTAVLGLAPGEAARPRPPQASAKSAKAEPGAVASAPPSGMVRGARLKPSPPPAPAGGGLPPSPAVPGWLVAGAAMGLVLGGFAWRRMRP